MKTRISSLVFLPALPVLFGLAACDRDLSIFYKSGQPVAQMQADQSACAAIALDKAPVRQELRQTPSTYTPPRTSCNSNGICTTTPGVYRPGTFYTVDANAPRRARYIEICMDERGYAPVDVPLCPVELRNSVPVAQTRTLPPLSDNSCAVKYDDGTWQILTPQPDPALAPE